MRRPVLLDGRNLYDPHEIAALGFTYCGVGVPSPPAALIYSPTMMQVRRRLSDEFKCQVARMPEVAE